MNTIPPGPGPLDLVQQIIPADYAPWPLAPGAAVGWRQGGRFCAFLVNAATVEASDQTANAILTRGDVEAAHTDDVVVIGGGSTLAMAPVFASHDLAVRVAYARVTLDEVGVRVTGALLDGAPGMMLWGSTVGAVWESTDAGPVLRWLYFVPAEGMPAGASLGEVRRALEGMGG